MAKIEKNGNCLRLQGALTMENANTLLDESVAMLAPGKLEMDLSGVAEVDSAAISLLFEWMRQAQDRQVDLTFSNLPSSLISLASLYGVLDLIPQSKH